MPKTAILLGLDKFQQGQMPELPEVETLVRGLKKADLIGRKIARVQIFLPKIASPANFTELIRDQIIADIFRRAKFAVFRLTDFYLTVHLRMTGHLFLKEKNFSKNRPFVATAPKKHEHAFIQLDDQRMLIYEDVRRFGKLSLVKDLGQIFAGLGPEPLDKEFSLEIFFKQLKKKKSKIKPVLLDQSFIAGLGNIYANEALFLAGIHPEKPALKISFQKALKLHSAIRQVLLEGIKNRGTSLGENYLHFSDLENSFGGHQKFLKVHGRYLQKCPLCQSLIRRKKIAQRTAFFCPRCQR